MTGYPTPRPYGVSVWDERTARRAAKLFAAHPSWFGRAFSTLRWTVTCEAPVECGSVCCLARGHVGEHESACDDPGCPGSCPA